MVCLFSERISFGRQIVMSGGQTKRESFRRRQQVLTLRREPGQRSPGKQLFLSSSFNNSLSSFTAIFAETTVHFSRLTTVLFKQFN